MSTPPNLIELQQQILDTLTLGHEILDREHEDVRKSVIEMQKFMTKDSLFVYSKKSEAEFGELVAKLSTAIATVDAVVSDDKKEMFKVQALANNVLREQPESQLPAVTEEKKSGISGLFNKTRQVFSKSAPYESELPEINKKLDKLVRLERFIEMYHRGIETRDTISNLDTEQQQEIMDDYIAIHRMIFPNDMGYHIIRIHKSYVEKTKALEKERVLSLGVANQRDLLRQEEEKRRMGG